MPQSFHDICSPNKYIYQFFIITTTLKTFRQLLCLKMLTRQVRSFALLHRRLIHPARCNRQHSSKPEHPFTRTVRILSEDLKNLTNIKKYNEKIRNLFPSHADVVIIGGGAMGSSIAYWLKEKTGKDSLEVVVLEKDPTVSLCLV